MRVCSYVGCSKAWVSKNADNRKLPRCGIVLDQVDELECADAVIRMDLLYAWVWCSTSLSWWAVWTRSRKCNWNSAKKSRPKQQSRKAGCVDVRPPLISSLKSKLKSLAIWLKLAAQIEFWTTLMRIQFGKLRAVLPRDNNITTGKIHREVIENSRRVVFYVGEGRN